MVNEGKRIILVMADCVGGTLPVGGEVTGSCSLIISSGTLSGTSLAQV